MKESVITSRANPLIKGLRALAQRKTREARGEFLVEGIQPSLHALDNGAAVQLLIVAHDILTSAAARDGIKRAKRRGIRVVEVSADVMETLGERERPTGLAAVVKIQPRALSELAVTPHSIFGALHRVSNPGNLGSILRTADAVGAGGVILIGTATDPYAPTAVKASRGALFTVPLVRIDHLQVLFDWCKQQNIKVALAADRAEQDMWAATLTAPLVLVFGNEGEGLPEEAYRYGNAVRIPMAGAIDSLNLASAASVLLYEALRQNRADSN